MNDLFTILIIIAAIISFLNKLFGKKKKADSDGQSKPEKPVFQWDLPWELKEEDEGTEVIEHDSEAQSSETPILQRKAELQSKYGAMLQEQSAKEQERPRLNLLSEEEEVVSLDGFSVDLSTANRLSEGIVLSEILGPCRARKRFI